MAKFRKKPVVIEAVQITDATFDAPHPNQEHVSGVIYDPVSRPTRPGTPCSPVASVTRRWWTHNRADRPTGSGWGIGLRREKEHDDGTES